MKTPAVKKWILYSGLIFGLTACVQTKYFVKSETDLSKIDLDKSLLIYIPIAVPDLFSSAILDSTYCLLQKKQIDKLDRYLKTIHTKTPDYFLSKTLSFMAQTEYQKAGECLRLIDDRYYKLTKQLLSIDLRYEQSRAAGSNDFSLLLKDYQALIDAYPENALLRKIVLLRIRYIRYNY